MLKNHEWKYTRKNGSNRVVIQQGMRKTVYDIRNEDICVSTLASVGYNKKGFLVDPDKNMYTLIWKNEVRS
jgi:hypothetical protein